MEILIILVIIAAIVFIGLSLVKKLFGIAIKVALIALVVLAILNWDKIAGFFTA